MERALTLRRTSDGYIVIFPGDDIRQTVDAVQLFSYSEEEFFSICRDKHEDALEAATKNEEVFLSESFDPLFIAQLMREGFIVMSQKIGREKDLYLLFPTHHILRTVLFFENLHIKKSIKPLLHRYELRFDTDFEQIVNRCIAVHGNGWLTNPLVDSIINIRNDKTAPVRPASFGLYDGNKLVAGEFGVVSGKIYTSYSGYCDENNTGTVQLILTSQYLEQNGYAFWDLGMPLKYKNLIGGKEIHRQRFIELFRSAQDITA